MDSSAVTSVRQRVSNSIGREPAELLLSSTAMVRAAPSVRRCSCCNMRPQRSEAWQAVRRSRSWCPECVNMPRTATPTRLRAVSARARPNAAHINEPTQQSNPPSTATSSELDALVQRVLQDGLPSTASESALETGRDEPHRERHGSIHDLPSLSSRLIGRSGDHSAMLGRNVVGLDTVAPAGDSVAAPATLFEPGPEPELERVSLDAERSGRFVLLMSPTLWPASNLVHRERFQIPDSCGSRLTHGCRSAGGSPPRRANHRHSWGRIHRNETCSARMLPTVMIPTPMRPPTGGQSSA